MNAPALVQSLVLKNLIPDSVEYDIKHSEKMGANGHLLKYMKEDADEETIQKILKEASTLPNQGKINMFAATYCWGICCELCIILIFCSGLCFVKRVYKLMQLFYAQCVVQNKMWLALIRTALCGNGASGRNRQQGGDRWWLKKTIYWMHIFVINFHLVIK